MGFGFSFGPWPNTAIGFGRRLGKRGLFVYGLRLLTFYLGTMDVDVDVDVE